MREEQLNGVRMKPVESSRPPVVSPVQLGTRSASYIGSTSTCRSPSVWGTRLISQTRRCVPICLTYFIQQVRPEVMPNQHSLSC